MQETLPASNVLLWEALPDLTLNIAQTAALCGITVRQLGYWTQQGFVSAQGRGARRAYGLDSVKRVLAIRKTMESGASLRQALHLVGMGHPPDPPPPLTSPVPVPAIVSSLSAEERNSLARSLQSFFQINPNTRDHAGGLAVKIGRAEDDVQTVAEQLCLLGGLTKNVCQGMTIFRQAPQEAGHV